MIGRIALAGMAAIAALGAGVFGVLVWQGARDPASGGEYVALGSSFAAGIGLGERAPGSPFVCMRSVGGYPSLLAKKAGLALVDMSCSGSTTSHVLAGGQMFLGPQLDAVGPAARLVTITSGGNDVGYIADLMFAAGSAGWVASLFRDGPKPLDDRDFAGVGANFRRIAAEVRRRAPQAKVVIVGYPAVLPAGEPCDRLGVDARTMALARQVVTRLDEVTRSAAEASGVPFIDMSRIGAGHDVCSTEPWVNGAAPAEGAAFHPNAAGAEAVAEAVLRAISDPAA